MDAALVLFDGDCNLCNASVRTIAANARAGRFRFAPLASDEARAALRGASLTLPHGADSVVLVRGGRTFVRSDAALRIARDMRPPWPLLAALLAVPRPLRDAVYAFVARNRHRWFG